MNKTTIPNPPRILTDWLELRLTIPPSDVTIDTHLVKNPEDPVSPEPTRFWALKALNNDARTLLEDAPITEIVTDIHGQTVIGVHDCDLDLLHTRCEDPRPDVKFHSPGWVFCGQDDDGEPDFRFKAHTDSPPETSDVFSNLDYYRTNRWWEKKSRHWHVYAHAVEHVAKKLEDAGFTVTLDDEMVAEQQDQHEVVIETWAGLTLEDEYSRINGPLAIQDVMASLDYSTTERQWDSEDRIWLINKDATYHVAEKLEDAGFDVELKDQRINLY